jgi:hypothetical protein
MDSSIKKIQEAIARKVNTVIEINGLEYLIRRGAQYRGGKIGIEIYAHNHTANQFLSRETDVESAADFMENYKVQ